MREGYAAMLLHRLYDIPDPTPRVQELRQCGVRFRRATPLDQAPVLAWLSQRREAINAATIGAVFSRMPPTAVVMACDQEIVACCFYDLDSFGTLGPLISAPGTPSAELLEVLVQVTLRTMFRVGYRYAVDWTAELLGGDPGDIWTTRLRPPGTRVAPNDRDLPELPWADMFIPFDGTLLDDEERSMVLQSNAIQIRRPFASEQSLVVDWVQTSFGRGFASEISRAFALTPISCLVAVSADQSLPSAERFLGFIGYNCSVLGLTGPLGVRPALRGTRLVEILARSCLHEMSQLGHRYGIIGGQSRRLPVLWAFPDAWTIPGSYPGVFRNVVANR